MASLSAHALPQSDADAVLRLLEHTPRPARSATDFEKWTHATLLFTAMDCWRLAGHDLRARVPAVLEQSPTISGINESRDDADLEAACHELATVGMAPRCDTGNFFADVAHPDPSLPRYYLQLNNEAEISKVRGVLECRLTQQPLRGTRQPFAALHVQAAWAYAPAPASFNLQGGTRVLKAASVTLRVPEAPDWDGKPFATTLTAVVPR